MFVLTMFVLTMFVYHFQFSCCGVQNYTDWESSYYNNRIINNMIIERNISYPSSCYPQRSNLTNIDYDDINIFKKVGIRI